MTRPVRYTRLGGGGPIIVPIYPTDDSQSNDDPQTHRVLSDSDISQIKEKLCVNERREGHGPLPAPLHKREGRGSR